MPYIITREQREALRDEAIAELSEIGDIYVALESDDFLLACNLSHEYRPLLWLLDDLGWEFAGRPAARTPRRSRVT